jgi:hypothetical protein
VCPSNEGFDVEALRRFLVKANDAGYAGGDEKQWSKETDRSITIAFDKGEWKSHDNFFGGEPYGGRTVVSYEGAPVWIMVYYGWVTPEKDANMAYGFLREALKAMPEEVPFRGPAVFEAKGLIYTNSWQGDLTRFSGREQITDGDSAFYEASYSGGLVDQRQAT